MTKKGIILFSILLICLVLVPFIYAAENDTEDSKVAEAYNCLETKINDKCDTLSYEEKIFSLLAVRECKEELLRDSVDEECFPKSSCNVKATAQAILALNKAGASTKDAEDWLFLQNKTPTDLSWYLQIDSDESTICEISYGSSSYSISIGENKKISSGGGCLSLAQDDYWLEISQSCYNEEFEISCDKSFITNLLFRKKGSLKIFISVDTHSASAEGRTTEKVNSFCFTKSNSCDYEASLWATLVLDYLGYEVGPYMSYLVTMAEGNSKFLPESFLYSLTADSDYRIELLEKQKFEFWDESGDKFYDTALALHPFQYEELTEKTNSKEWFLEIQDKQGCWQGNIRNTAFILYSVWPKDYGGSGGEVYDDCEIDADGFCISSVSCEEAGGDELYSYSSSCSGLNVCCNKEKVYETCDELNGGECPFGERCSTSTIETLDVEECCLGYCREPVETPDCEVYGGTCRDSCSEDEEESSDSCSFGESCCIEKSTPDKKSYWWIWALLILIVLVLIGIIFRNKLRPYWFKLKSKFSKKPRAPPRGRYPFGMRPSQRRLVPRRPLRGSRRVPQRTPRQTRFPGKIQEKRTPVKKPVTRQKSKDLDDVLKKLKEMGK